MSRWWGFAALLATVQAAGAPRIVVVASGDCQDDTLLETATLLRNDLKKSIGKEMAPDELIQERLGRQPPLSVEEVQRQLAAAQTHFYGAQYDRAHMELTQLRKNVHRLPMGPRRREITIAIEAHHALLLRSVGREREADASFVRILRLDPRYELDLDLYPQSTVQRFRQLRSELGKLSMETVEIVSAPAGARVYLDGVEAGTTPYLGVIPKGTYRLELQHGGAWALPRDLVVNGRTTVQVNLEFESAIRPGPCIATSEGERERLLRAVQVGAALGIDRVVLLRLEDKQLSRRWLAVEMIQVGTGEKVREGGLKVTKDGRAPADGVAEMAQFVLTGQRSDRIVDLPAERGEVAAIQVPVRSESSLPPEPVAEAPSNPTGQSAESLAVPAPAAQKMNWPRLGAFGLVGAGAVGIGLGVASQVRLFSIAEEFEANRTAPNPDENRLRVLRDDFEATEIRMFIGYGAGVAAAAAGGFLLYRTWPEATEVEKPQVTAVPLRGGGMIQVGGSF